MHLISIPAFQDNYIWLLTKDSQTTIIVDPGTAQPVIQALQQHQLTPDAILLTHHHNDHTGGVAELVRHYPALKVYGPEETRSKGAQIIVKEGDHVVAGGMTFSVLDVPGHTIGHIAFYCSPYLFCGDTLFSAGCGRIFEGTAKQMYHSIQKLAALPDNTKVCCAHEYTLSNLRFANYVLPEDIDIETYQQQIEQLRAENQASVPTELQLERKINLFLRCHQIDLQRKLGINDPTIEIWQVFKQLRAMKDNY
ncbi:hydroxyacylglutathione hydrolase [Pragia fontium]|uniref:Hydroxyacylglutathione hydrolase n=1 Tax=Pragia fontium TaxID=82985 RepID=A0ABQ5LFE9_9GAMM|nr:hydroxyacylglutathione hydrolase [Pragia fontium]AKJ42837.1 hydroxyacylglutathione hydrolase [Pragia fontium]GKX62275.1 hydroxyacylglutathione hydrolase [Pragia fontium]